MKTIIPILALAFSLNCFAQEGYQSLTAAEYANVKFQGVSFEAIKATDGNVQAMRDLFPLSTNNSHPDSFTIDEFGSEIGEPQRYFYFNSGMKVSFDLGGPSESIEIVRLESPDITVLGHHLEIGDSIDVLGNDIEFNINRDSSKSILFIKNNGTCCPIVIDLDANMNITVIYYLIFA
ncbi:hypothetical protein [Psychroflexus montanilacus]|uniref:hypothetical protein n=1 Tax=Psychroflexus montanilacus TaxID=2873598 RepID=UPI001CC943CA|nr:hypothetical protein [Psychroflexus montanilacus]MBZ9652195.1 hypothetical protein [Psychroflexus montanilacus]